tara:strand:- start:5527 stop:6204 length:678 start_codon:yes stop_codon:yes gene_type:complete
MPLIHSRNEAIELINSKKILIFDFDGVILDSVHIKTEAFGDLYIDFGEDIADLVKKYHEENGGMSRFEKIKYYNDVLLADQHINESCDSMAEKFSELVFDKVVIANEIPGVMDFIKHYKKKSIPMAINSATPTEELIQILISRDLKRYFSQIMGSPTSKYENLVSILEANQADRKDAIFFGDAESDLLAADKIGMDFIGIGEFIKEKDVVFSSKQFNAINFIELI